MRILLHSFYLGDVDDVDIYIADPLYQWKQSEQGQWAMDHAHNLTYFCTPDPVRLGHRIDITGELVDGPLVTEFLLKWNTKQY